jgi:hypothetical protein
MATAAAAVPRTTAPRLLYVGLSLLAVAIGYGVVVIVIGLVTAYARFALRVRAGEVEGAQAQLLGPLLDMLVFAPFFAAAVYYRRKPELHKRLMIVATTSMLIAAASRMQFLGEPRILFVHLIWTAPILVAIAHDFWQQRRIHRVYVVGLVVLLVTGPLGRLPARTSELWLDLSSWLVPWAA